MTGDQDRSGDHGEDADGSSEARPSASKRSSGGPEADGAEARRMQRQQLPIQSPPPDGPREDVALEAFFHDPIQRFEFLYGNLSILDSKASSLMAFNAIGLTALAIWLEYVPANLLHLSLDIIFVLLLLSSAICFWVVRVRWASAAAFMRPEGSTKELLDIRDRRTIRYRRAWLLSVISVIAFGVVSTVHMAGTALRASGSCGESCARFFSPAIWGNRESGTESTSPAPDAVQPAPNSALAPRPSRH